MKYNKGFQFLDMNSDFEVIEYMERHNMYRLKNLTTGEQNDLKSEVQIDQLVINKEVSLQKRESNRLFWLRQEEQERKEKEKQATEEYKYNFCNGYCDNKTALQSGKILKALNKTLYYNGKHITRKDFIQELIENNSIKLKIVNNNNRYSDKKIDLEYKKLKDKTEYRIYTENDGFYEITKTEYDYAEYLLKAM